MRFDIFLYPQVKIMKSINFPSIHEANPDANYIPKEKPSHRRRNRMVSFKPFSDNQNEMQR